LRTKENFEKIRLKEILIKILTRERRKWEVWWRD